MRADQAHLRPPERPEPGRRVPDEARPGADVARTITLVPGDVILSGTPANSRPVQPGDVVTVEVEGLGALTNTVVEGDTPVREDVGAQPSESEEVVSTALGGDWEFRGIRPPRRG